MLLKIVGLGHDSLRRKNEKVSKDDKTLEALLADMYETMYNANGVGLAAPQIDRALRLFIVDGEPMEDIEGNDQDMTDFKIAFINPEILEETGSEWEFEEGCLSIPDIREKVSRHSTIKIRYQDKNFDTHTKTFTGLKARIIQHEYDHIEGILFTDHINGMRKRILKNRLIRIRKGMIKLTYPMKFKN